ncbi:1-deoxy-D-xylulose-5-phosphate reductoisomerase [Bogoriella caseilytica]|uniref:1-deoxy-D-xylulose 5-phosphate reductoisomerase n=1 Tax=Bogoriella caseilytica TaxID=56055 RepID=A0A3N2BG25_9MICO|nr:1-deoxy-D-xylulose-5-phosphate reductoisomerase [Bogoriella caseilytica]ROR74014.1 1-deoxy-D-xylulose 5-phosphate reductoisomerase [Bogoriella caseilytica]
MTAAASSPRDLVILGSTGSIGTQALEVVAAHPGRFRVRALTAGGSDPALLAAQALDFGAETVVVARAEAVAPLREALAARNAESPGTAPGPEVLAGAEAQAGIAGSLREDGVVLNGVTGSVGLAPTLAALRSGATLGLANKESLVVGGALVQAAQVRPGQVVPVDSEHSAMAQALASGRHEKGMTSPVITGRSEVRRLVLTASGGPFRGKRRADLTEVTPEQALAHPTWAMGPVNTLNSSTLINKGLELIEASLLFDIPADDITVVVHPQSVVHSMVEFHDGSTMAQASPPDMRLPIALGLSWPERLPGVSEPCSWDQAATWTFEPLDEEVFPAVSLARAAADASATHPAVLNAANEQCVDAFLAGRLDYLGIVDTVREVLEEHDGPAGEASLDGILGAEERARARADELISRRAG